MPEVPFAVLDNLAEGWAEPCMRDLAPGGHVIALGLAQDVIEARRCGLELRDTLMAVLPGPTIKTAFLFRKPLQESSIALQASRTSTGSLNIGACRVGTTGGTKRSHQMPYPKKADGSEDRSQSWARTGHSIVKLDLGRWPANVIFVHDTECNARTCGPRCPTFALGGYDGKNVLYPQVDNETDLRVWFERLISPPSR